MCRPIYRYLSRGGWVRKTREMELGSPPSSPFGEDLGANPRELFRTSTASRGARRRGAVVGDPLKTDSFDLLKGISMFSSLPCWFDLKEIEFMTEIMFCFLFQWASANGRFY